MRDVFVFVIDTTIFFTNPTKLTPQMFPHTPYTPWNQIGSSKCLVGTMKNPFLIRHLIKKPTCIHMMKYCIPHVKTITILPNVVNHGYIT